MMDKTDIRLGMVVRFVGPRLPWMIGALYRVEATRDRNGIFTVYGSQRKHSGPSRRDPDPFERTVQTLLGVEELEPADTLGGCDMRSDFAMKFQCIRDERDPLRTFRNPLKGLRDTPYTRRRIEAQIGPGCFPSHSGPPRGGKLA